ncbi:hypothetical protein FTUN_0586 [Frigoriglobus tundricola]|uniref:Uncharacterized protein n=1 Tax=Frigoriglobus tundricola TaxID=2774151 RepID=A0A6M5YHS7_9BACT|nr:hypothetical protein FTUN_0586 [Frigoriglobus tundricola]
MAPFRRPGDPTPSSPGADQGRTRRPSGSNSTTQDAVRGAHRAGHLCPKSPRITVRDELGEVVTVIKIVSPGNKDTENSIQEEPFELPADSQLTAGGYSAEDLRDTSNLSQWAKYYPMCPCFSATNGTCLSARSSYLATWAVMPTTSDGCMRPLTGDVWPLFATCQRYRMSASPYSRSGARQAERGGRPAVAVSGAAASLARTQTRPTSESSYQCSRCRGYFSRRPSDFWDDEALAEEARANCRRTGGSGRA